MTIQDDNSMLTALGLDEEVPPEPDEVREASDEPQETAGDGQASLPIGEGQEEPGQPASGQEGGEPVEAAPDDEGMSEGELREAYREAVRARDGILGELQERRRDVQRYNRRIDQMQELVNAVVSRSQQTQGEAPVAAEEIPDKEEDPIGYAAAMSERTARMLEEERANRASAVAQNEQAQKIEQLAHFVHQDRERFTQERPDYQSAVDFFMQSFKAELKAQYPNATEDEIMQQIVQRWEPEFVVDSLQNQLRPAERLYRLAVARGYRPQANGNGGTPATPVNPAAPRRKTPRSLSQATPTGRGAVPGIDLRELSKITDDAEYARTMNKLIEQVGEDEAYRIMFTGGRRRLGIDTPH